MVAGPNGSGKSTLIAALRSDQALAAQLPATYVNADDLQRQHGLDDQAAQRMAAEQRRRALDAGRDLLYETVMSHPSKLAELQQARSAGYEIHVHFLATADASINVARVALRVAAGGHDVPRERIAQRHARVLALAPTALGLADQALVYDNSEAVLGIRLQALGVAGRLLELDPSASAAWVRALASRMEERVAELAHVRNACSGMLALARLDDGITTGRVVHVGRHLALQQVADGPAVLHDLALLPSGLLAADADFEVAYREGVAHCRRRVA